MKWTTLTRDTTRRSTETGECARKLLWIGRTNRPPTLNQVLKLWNIGNIITIISVLFALACLLWAILSG